MSKTQATTTLLTPISRPGLPQQVPPTLPPTMHAAQGFISEVMQQISFIFLGESSPNGLNSGSWNILIHPDILEVKPKLFTAKPPPTKQKELLLGPFSQTLMVSRPMGGNPKRQVQGASRAASGVPRHCFNKSISENRVYSYRPHMTGILVSRIECQWCWMPISWGSYLYGWAHMIGI